MTKYTDHYKQDTRSKAERLGPHPIWRGIGLVFLIVLPVMSFLIVSYFIENPSLVPWLEIPKEIVFQNLWDPFIAAKLIGTILVAFVLFIAISFFTFLINSIAGR